MQDRRFFREVTLSTVAVFTLLGSLIHGGCNTTPPPPDYNVAVTVQGEGTVTKSGDGPEITLTAVPATRWEFDSWTGADVPDESEITVDAREITAITVVFVLGRDEADADNDGVTDDDDQCAGTPPGESVDDEGCSEDQADADGDGVANGDDDCENTPTTVTVDANGCPVGDPTSGDGDADGVPNNIDQCLTTPAGATVDANGCAATERDTDDDGVNDNLDDCPNTPAGTDVEADGCPSGGGGNDPVCGNDDVETGEECDDGNTTNGDGCSSTCQDEGSTGGPDNNSCADAEAVEDGTTSISNDGATTDGPDEATLCDYFNRTQVDSDVWFCYEATCTGEAVISLCGSSYDTKMAVYDGCDCPTVTNSAVACSDDDCGSGVESVQSRVTVNVTTGQSYLIRVGGYIGAQGDGQLTISCGAGDVCQTATGSCLEASDDDTPGCEDEACCNSVCDVDQFCCDINWDEFCASEAEGLCDEGFDVCAPSAGDCDADSAEPGCNNVSCCNTVCERDPFCCIDQWDDNCASEANAFCALTCNSRAGDCFGIHGTPGCNLTSCCLLVCPEDPFCCDTEWDSGCVDRANEACR